MNKIEEKQTIAKYAMILCIFSRLFVDHMRIICHAAKSIWASVFGTVTPLWSILLFIWFWIVKQCSLEKIQAKVFGLSFCWINIPLATGIMHFGLAIGLENTNQMNLFSFSTPIYLKQQTFLSQVSAISATYYNQRRVMDTRSSLFCVSWYLFYIC